VIVLSRLNGQVVAINSDLILWIEVLPDTTISMVGGDKMIVRESLDEVIGRVIAYRSQLGKIEAIRPGSPTAAVAIRQSQRPSSRPAPRPVFPPMKSDPPPPIK